MTWTRSSSENDDIEPMLGSLGKSDRYPWEVEVRSRQAVVKRWLAKPIELKAMSVGGAERSEATLGRALMGLWGRTVRGGRVVCLKRQALVEPLRSGLAKLKASAWPRVSVTKTKGRNLGRLCDPL